MTSPVRTRRRWRAAAATTLGVALVASGTAVANAAAPPAALSFVVATNQVTLDRYVFPDGGSWVEGSLGAYLVAGKDPFEIRVSRKSYADKLVAKQVVVKNGKKTNVTLPAGMVTDFTGFKDFSTITMKDAAGATVLSQGNDFCPSPSGSVRTRPDAPATTPYPESCSYINNPFLLNHVWGIQAGWTAQIDLSENLDLPDGTYQATLEIAKKYRDFLKLPAGQGATTLAVTVKTTVIDEEGGAAVRARAKSSLARASSAKADHAHASEGNPQRQAAQFDPELRPPTRRPATVSRAAAPKGPRPDLRSLPAWGVGLTDGESEDGTPDGRKYIAFAATVWNAGTSPLTVDGFRRTGTDLMDAYQYFFDAKGKQVGSVQAGTMEWDKRDGHNHWHFTDFAQYRLLGADKKLVVRSGKEAFCLANTDRVDDALPNAKWRPSNTDLSTSCGQNSAVAVRQVLDIGNGDTYHQGLPGQSFDVTDVPNGTYYIEVLANPVNKLVELSTTNNSALRKVVLSGSGADRQLTVPSVHGLDG